MTTYLNCNEDGSTWRQIIEQSGWTRYAGVSDARDVVIRWGANAGRYGDTYARGTRVLNQNLMLNKFEQLQRMAEAGVNVPLFWTGQRGFEQAGSPEQCVVKRASGSRGYGIRLIPATQMYNADGSFRLRDERDRDIYYQQYIDKTHEYRVMAVGNTIAFYMEKTAPEGGGLTWNLHQGAEWSSIEDAPRDLRRRLKELSVSALRAISYDLGAVDVLRTASDGLYVLEVNSKPEFGERNTIHFINAINSLLEEETNSAEVTERRDTGEAANRLAQQMAGGREINWAYCPFCGVELDEHRGGWAYCAYCGHGLV